MSDFKNPSKDEQLLMDSFGGGDLWSTRMKRISVFCSFEGYVNTFQGFITEMTAKIAEAGYIHTANIDVNLEPDGPPSLLIYYERPETHDEIEERVHLAWQKARDTLAAEKTLYEHLKQKYDPGETTGAQVQGGTDGSPVRQDAESIKGVPAD